MNHKVNNEGLRLEAKTTYDAIIRSTTQKTTDINQINDLLKDIIPYLDLLHLDELTRLIEAIAEINIYDHNFLTTWSTIYQAKQEKALSGQITSSLYSIIKLKFYDKGLLNNLFNKIKLLDQLDHSNQAIEIINNLVALSSNLNLYDIKNNALKIGVISILDYLLSKAKENIHNLSSDQLARLIHDLSKLAYRDEDLLHQWSEKILPNHDMDVEDVVISINAMARLGYLSGNTIYTLIDKLSANINHLDLRASVNLMFSLSMIHLTNIQNQDINLDMIKQTIQTLYREKLSINSLEMLSTESTQQLVSINSALQIIDPDFQLFTIVHGSDNPIQISRSQWQYDQFISSIGIPHQSEHFIAEIGSCVDLFLPPFRHISQSTIIQFDGPSHFYLNKDRVQKASTIFQTKILQSKYLVYRCDYRTKDQLDAIQRFFDEVLSSQSVTQRVNQDLITSSAPETTKLPSATTQIHKTKPHNKSTKKSPEKLAVDDLSWFDPQPWYVTQHISKPSLPKHKIIAERDLLNMCQAMGKELYNVQQASIEKKTTYTNDLKKLITMYHNFNQTSQKENDSEQLKKYVELQKKIKTKCEEIKYKIQVLDKIEDPKIYAREDFLRNIDTMKLYVSAGGKINSSNLQYFKQIFELFIKYHSNQALFQLIQYQAMKEISAEELINYYIRAAMSDNVEAMKIILEIKDGLQNDNPVCSDGFTALHNAIASHSVRVVKFLLEERNINPNLYCKSNRDIYEHGNIPLFSSVYRSFLDARGNERLEQLEANQREIMRLLLDHGAEIDIRSDDVHILQFAIQHNCIEFVQLFIVQNPEYLYMGYLFNQANALELAIQSNNDEIIKFIEQALLEQYHINKQVKEEINNQAQNNHAIKKFIRSLDFIELDATTDFEAIKAESLKQSQETMQIGPRSIDGFEIEDVAADGNCFYYAIERQIQDQASNHRLIRDLPSGTALSDILRLAVQGTNSFNDGEWSDDLSFDAFVRSFPEFILAIIDTRHPEAGFNLRYMDADGTIIYHAGDSDLTIPNDRIIIRIAATGNHFMSVRSNPTLEGGAIHEAWNIEHRILSEESNPTLDASAIHGSAPIDNSTQTYYAVVPQNNTSDTSDDYIGIAGLFSYKIIPDWSSY